MLFFNLHIYCFRREYNNLLSFSRIFHLVRKTLFYVRYFLKRCDSICNQSSCIFALILQYNLRVDDLKGGHRFKIWYTLVSIQSNSCILSCHYTYMAWGSNHSLHQCSSTKSSSFCIQRLFGCWHGQQTCECTCRIQMSGLLCSMSLFLCHMY